MLVPSIFLLSFHFGHLLFQTGCNVFTRLKQHVDFNGYPVVLLVLLLVFELKYFQIIILASCLPLTEIKFGTETICQLTCPPWNVLDVPHSKGSAHSSNVFFFWCYWPVSV